LPNKYTQIVIEIRMLWKKLGNRNRPP